MIYILYKNFLLEIQAVIMRDSAEYLEHPVELSGSCNIAGTKKLEGAPDLTGGTHCLQNLFINIEMWFVYK